MDFTQLEVHEIASNVDVTALRKLGYHLGFDHDRIQRFERANTLNPTQCDGTEDMLMVWHSRGGTRAQLCEALRRVEQGRLAIRIESGEFNTQPVAAPHPPHPLHPPQPFHERPNRLPEPVAKLHPTSTSSQFTQRPNIPNTQQNAAARGGNAAVRVVDMEQVLPELASDLTQEQFERLALPLGFTRAEMSRFSATNFLTGRVTTRGTLDMLFEFRARTAEEEQSPRLRAALLRLQLRALADKYFPQA